MITPLKVVTLLAIAGLATAYSYHVSWLAPTERVDGSPLLVTDIASYRIEWGWCAVGSAVQSQVAPGPALDAYVALPQDTYCWRVYAVDNFGNSSESSNVIAFHESSDTDGDGIQDFLDNCPIDYNQTQTDSDNDGVGNRCDADFNNDGYVNAQDYILFRQQWGQLSQPPTYNVADMNANGHVNAQDYILFRQRLGQ